MERFTHPNRIRRRDDFWGDGDASGEEAGRAAAPRTGPSVPPKPALPYLDGWVAPVDGRPQLRTRFPSRGEAPWALQPAVEEAWLRARNEPRVGVVYRRAGDPFSLVYHDGYVCIGELALLFIQGRNVDDIGDLIDRFVSLGCERIVSLTHGAAMEVLAGKQPVLVGQVRRPTVRRSDGGPGRPFATYIATTAPLGDDPGAVVALDVELYVHYGDEPMRVVGVRRDAARALERYRAGGHLALAASDLPGLYAEAALRLPDP